MPVFFTVLRKKSKLGLVTYARQEVTLLAKHIMQKYRQGAIIGNTDIDYRHRALVQAVGVVCSVITLREINNNSLLCFKLDF